MKRFSNVVGFDDAPFARDYAGRVAVVGAVYADLRLDGVLTGEVQKDGADAADVLGALILGSQFAAHSRIPEPIRTAHLIAGALANGQSRATSDPDIP